MHRYPITAGDTVYVPGGIIHSFGPDTLIYEIQQTSDLGQMVMPTDLYGKRYSDEEWDANIRAALEELKKDYLPKPNAGLEIRANGNSYRIGGVCEHFVVERWTLTEPHHDDQEGRRCGLLSNVGEAVTIRYAGG